MQINRCILILVQLTIPHHRHDWLHLHRNLQFVVERSDLTLRTSDFRSLFHITPYVRVPRERYWWTRNSVRTQDMINKPKWERT